MSEWITIGRIGYLGGLKGKAHKFLDDRFGKYWRKTHVVGDKAIDRATSLRHYEDSYVEFFRSKPETLDWLVRTAKDVYDTDPSNVNSGTDYLKQEGKATHLQDIAVRRAIESLGERFRGDRLIEIRGHESEGYILNPGKIRFHKPELIIKPNRRSWWDEDSIEDFWQSNKVIQIRADRMKEYLESKEFFIDREVSELDRLILVWNTFGDEPTLYGVGVLETENDLHRFHVKSEFPYGSLEMIERDCYYREIIASNVDLLLRAGDQLPKKTLKKLGKKAKEIVVISS